ncbi:hypothetical protein GGI12_005065 [Dipsacomyces acuminosporus]|nr:hypothetical protein GGI12_005065 [Dipsacomyces acuminosporus]
MTTSSEQATSQQETQAAETPQRAEQTRSQPNPRKRNLSTTTEPAPAAPETAPEQGQDHAKQWPPKKPAKKSRPTKSADAGNSADIAAEPQTTADVDASDNSGEQAAEASSSTSNGAETTPPLPGIAAIVGVTDSQKAGEVSSGEASRVAVATPGVAASAASSGAPVPPETVVDAKGRVMDFKTYRDLPRNKKKFEDLSIAQKRAISRDIYGKMDELTDDWEGAFDYLLKKTKRGMKMSEKVYQDAELVDNIMKNISEMHTQAPVKYKAAVLALVAPYFSNTELKQKDFKFSNEQLKHARKKNKERKFHLVDYVRAIPPSRMPISDAVKELIVEYLERNSAPGSSRSETKTLMKSKNDIYQQLKEDHPDIKLSKAKFYNLCPKNYKVMSASSSSQANRQPHTPNTPQQAANGQLPQAQQQHRFIPNASFAGPSNASSHILAQQHAAAAAAVAAAAAAHTSPNSDDIPFPLPMPMPGNWPPGAQRWLSDPDLH